MEDPPGLGTGRTNFEETAGVRMEVRNEAFLEKAFLEKSWQFDDVGIGLYIEQKR